MYIKYIGKIEREDITRGKKYFVEKIEYIMDTPYFIFFDDAGDSRERPEREVEIVRSKNLPKEEL